MRNNLDKTGLSLSQAASISNLCNQRASEISNTISGINNSSKVFKTNGETYMLQVGKPVPTNIVELLVEKGQLHATQAFLMSNIKAKDALINDLKKERFINSLVAPEQPEYHTLVIQDMVGEDWGWDSLSKAEYSEYLEQEAYASHIGQFIHKNCPLDVLRKDLPNVKVLDFIELQSGIKTPVKVEAHHTSEELLSFHEKLAALHRSYEQRVNYFKAKVKNLVTEENARISKENAVKASEINLINQKLRQDYSDLMSTHSEAATVAFGNFESDRQIKIQQASALRISIDPRFQGTIDLFLKNLDPES
jgi:hypothetical protein